MRVRTTDGASHTFQVSAVGETSLVGNAAGTWKSGADLVGSRIELPYQDIEQIDSTSAL